MLHVLLFFLLSALTPVSALAWPGQVTSVHDGDTLRVLDPHGKTHKVRIYGVDCPELGQPYGREAKAMTEQMVLGLTIEVVPTQKAKSYKRDVAGIIMLDALVVVQDVLVSMGLAWVDDRFCKLQVCDLWRMHQRDAQNAEPLRGLWNDADALAPWDWRAARKKKNQR